MLILLQLKAKGVFEQELTTLRAKRAEKEKALGAERLRASNQGRPKDEPDNPTTDVTPAVASPPNEQPAASSLAAGAAKEISDVSAKIDPDQSHSKNEFNGAGSLNKEDSGTPIQPGVANDLAKQTLDGLGISGDVEIDASDFNHITADDDFDSMFADTTANPNDVVNFDLDFSTDQAVSQDLLSGNAFGNVGPSADDLGSINQASSEDINTLLPGLENYVNEDGESGGDDFAMIDIPVGDAGLEAGKTAASRPSVSTTVKEDTSIMGTANLDSSMDDMFDMSGDFGGESTMDNLEFDEWFQNGN